MPDTFDSLGQPSFAGIRFPITGYTLHGGQRKKVHSYPHVNSGKAEKLGREVYTVHVQALFDESLAQQYPDIWPNGLNALLAKFESGVTGPLFLPTRGTINAFCDGWSVEMSASLRSGERCDLTFTEDDEVGFLEESILAASSASVLARALSVAELRALYDAELTTKDKSLFDQIDDAANAVHAVVDSVEFAGNVVSAKVARLVSLCGEVESAVSAIQDPRSYPLFEAVKELWDAGARIGADVAGKRTPVQTYTVPAKTALPQLSQAIFGTGDRGSDLLELNFFDDAFAIQAGTVVSYYPDTT